MRPGGDRPLFLPADPEGGSSPAVDKAAEAILSGAVVAFPTESFYGLGVNAMDERAVERLFHVKKRPDDNPILILIPSVETLERYVVSIPETACRLMDAFWPGGLTMLFEAGPRISPLLTAGTGKIGIRLSSHPLALALVRATGVPVTGTSANETGEPACVLAEEVFRSLGDRVDLILDGGRTAGGKGSTVLDVTVHPPVILRPGMVGREDLDRCL